MTNSNPNTGKLGLKERFLIFLLQIVVGGIATFLLLPAFPRESTKVLSYTERLTLYVALTVGQETPRPIMAKLEKQWSKEAKAKYLDENWERLFHVIYVDGVSRAVEFEKEALQSGRSDEFVEDDYFNPAVRAERLIQEISRLQKDEATRNSTADMEKWVDIDKKLAEMVSSLKKDPLLGQSPRLQQALEVLKKYNASFASLYS